MRVQLPAVRSTDDAVDFPARPVREGRQAKDFARMLLESCDFVDIRSDVKFSRLGIELSFLAFDQTGHGSRTDEFATFFDRFPQWSRLGRMVSDTRAGIDAARLAA